MDQQQLWDQEDMARFRRRARELNAAICEARDGEREARSLYATARRRRREAELELAAFLEADSRPLPLFDRRDGRTGDPEPPPPPPAPEPPPPAPPPAPSARRHERKATSRGVR